MLQSINDVVIYSDAQRRSPATTISPICGTPANQTLCSRRKATQFVREGAARDKWITGYINTTHNPSDILMKALKLGENRKRKASSMLNDLYSG